MHSCLWTQTADLETLGDQLTAEELATLFYNLLIACAWNDGLLVGEFGHHRVLAALRLLAELEEERQVLIFVFPGEATQNDLLEIVANE